MAALSADQRTNRQGVVAMSKELTGGPPEKGITANRAVGPVFSSTYEHATSVPSGETTGYSDTPSYICSGSPPSIGTFHKVRFPVLIEEKTTQVLAPTEAQRGSRSSWPKVSCFGLPPSLSIRQTLTDPPRSELKT